MYTYRIKLRFVWDWISYSSEPSAPNRVPGTKIPLDVFLSQKKKKMHCSCSKNHRPLLIIGTTRIIRNVAFHLIMLMMLWGISYTSLTKTQPKVICFMCHFFWSVISLCSPHPILFQKTYLEDDVIVCISKNCNGFRTKT